ncbi:MAG: 7,8-didemethyl-8-hydroxy-5-deazariboflavin synthase subunit CofG [Candidatus Helarchaeota archaeon]
MTNNYINLSSDLKEIFERRLYSKIKNKGMLLNIFNLKGTEFSLIMAYSNYLFKKFNKNIITYSKNVFLPLTSHCRNSCKYCNFKKEPNEHSPLYMTPKQILSIIKLAEEKNCKEALLTMGEKPEEKYSDSKLFLKELGNYSSTIEYLISICELILKKSSLLPHSNPGLMSFEELKQLKEVNASLGLMLENISPRLMEKNGPHEFSPGKDPDLRIKTIIDAGKLKIPFTTGILIGIGETNQEIIDSLIKIDEINEKYGHIQEIIIQGYTPRNDQINNINNNTSGLRPPSIFKLIKTIIIAKLITDIPIQTPPNLNTSFQIFLSSGIDDWGGISPLTPDYINPDHPWPKLKDIRSNTEEFGYILKERLAIYPKFIKKEFISSNLQHKIFNYVDNEGYVK